MDLNTTRAFAAIHGMHRLHAFPPLPEVAEANRYEPGDFRRRLAEWMVNFENREEAQLQPEPTAQQAATDELSDSAGVWQVSEDIRSALSAAVAIGMAHSAEMLMLALSNHPLVRLSAVSHPYVLAILIESFLKKTGEVSDPDPRSRTGPRYEEKIIASLVNWNHVQPLLDTMLKSTLARSLKVVVTAGIGGLRDMGERSATRRRLAALPDDAPDGARKLTPMESIFIVCMLCWLRNVAVDLPRQIVKSQPAGALPAIDRAAERFLRLAVLGSQVPGSLPASCIVAQAAFVEAVRDASVEPAEGEPETDANTKSATEAALRMAYQVNNLF